MTFMRWTRSRIMIGVLQMAVAVRDSLDGPGLTQWAITGQWSAS